MWLIDAVDSTAFSLNVEPFSGHMSVHRDRLSVAARPDTAHTADRLSLSQCTHA
jgi:hypothetical protein